MQGRYSTTTDYSIVVEAREEKVYFYNKEGTILTLQLEKLLEL